MSFQGEVPMIRITFWLLSFALWLSISACTLAQVANSSTVINTPLASALDSESGIIFPRQGKDRS